MSIQTELVALKKDGLLVAERVHEWAEAHPESDVHKALEWDNEAAAYEHRLWQIRRLIAVHVTYEGGERKFISLSIDRSKDGGGYRDLDDVIKDRSLYAIALKDALQELQRLQERYEHLKELRPVWSAVKKIKTRTTAKTKGGADKQQRTSSVQHSTAQQGRA
jgi:hypothetical protein